MNITDIRTAIADALAPLSINPYSYAPDAPQTPAAFIYPDPFDFRYEFSRVSAKIQSQFVVRFLINATGESSQNQLDELISPEGPNSAVALIVGITSSEISVAVDSLRNYGVIVLPDGDTRYLSAELVVSVIG